MKNIFVIISLLLLISINSCYSQIKFEEDVYSTTAFIDSRIVEPDGLKIIHAPDPQSLEMDISVLILIIMLLN